MNCGRAIWGKRSIQGRVECVDMSIMPNNLSRIGKAILLWCGTNLDLILNHNNFDLNEDWATCRLELQEMLGIQNLPFDFSRVDITLNVYTSDVLFAIIMEA